MLLKLKISPKDDVSYIYINIYKIKNLETQKMRGKNAKVKLKT